MADCQSPAESRLDNITVARKGRLTAQCRILLIQSGARGLNPTHRNDADQADRHRIVIRQINAATTSLGRHDCYRRIQVISGRTYTAARLQSQAGSRHIFVSVTRICDTADSGHDTDITGACAHPSYTDTARRLVTDITARGAGQRSIRHGHRTRRRFHIDRTIGRGRRDITRGVLDHMAVRQHRDASCARCHRGIQCDILVIDHHRYLGGVGLQQNVTAAMSGNCLRNKQ